MSFYLKKKYKKKLGVKNEETYHHKKDRKD